MTTHQIKLKRTPKAVTVDKQTVKIEVGSRSKPPQTSNAANGSAATPGAPATASPPGPAPRPKPSSVANVISNPVDRSVTPLSRSNAVPVLSNAAHEVVKAQDVGLGGVDPEELLRLKQLLADAAEAVVELQSQHRQSLGEMQLSLIHI